MQRPLAFARNNPNGTSTFVQEGLQRHRGVELFASGPISNSVSVIGGVSVFDPVQVRTANPLQDGKQAPGVPRMTASLTADWRVQQMPGLGIFAGVFYFDRQFVDTQERAAIPSWTRFDGGIRYSFRVGKARSTALFNVDNLLDKNYWASAGAGLQHGTPRTWRLSVRTEF
jgi:iron complex outermembrane receptor protein